MECGAKAPSVDVAWLKYVMFMGVYVFFFVFFVCVCLKGHVPGLQVNCFGN